MARRHRHNTGGGRQPRQKLLDLRREDHFRYDVRQVLGRGDLDEGEVNALMQMILSRGSRSGIEEAKDFVQEKVDEEVIDPEQADKLESLIDRYSTFR